MRQPGPDDVVDRTATSFRALVARGWALPLPGGGATAARWAALADLGTEDLGLARLAEGHADATAVLAELDGPDPGPGCPLGVWAAEPPWARLEARRTGAGWRLDGRKAWCSGAGSVTGALVTAAADDGLRLFLADLPRGRVRVDADVWASAGMRGSDTADVELDDVPALPVGGPGDYVGRPGFWHGGIGVAAVWLGGARRVAGTLRASAAGRDPDPLLDLAVGTVDTWLSTADAVLAVAAAEVDTAPADLPAARLRAMRARAVVARAAEEVLTTVGHALGAGPLARDAGHAAAVADLTVYLRQHHAERDVAALGSLLRDGRPR